MLATDEGEIETLETLDSPWMIDTPPVPLLVMVLAPDCNPDHREPVELKVHLKGKHYRFPFKEERGLLIKLRALLRRYDPDLLLTVWGDNWLITKLHQLMEKHQITLPLSREQGRGVERREERFYHSYGRVIYRGPQARLFGRIHISKLASRAVASAQINANNTPVPFVDAPKLLLHLIPVGSFDPSSAYDLSRFVDDPARLRPTKGDQITILVVKIRSLKKRS